MLSVCGRSSQSAHRVSEYIGEDEVRQVNYAVGLLAVFAIGLSAQDVVPSPHHQAPDEDGVYYVGPEVSAPQLVRTVYVPYPNDDEGSLKGMTVLAMVVEANGKPAHIQIIHTHGDAFDQAVIAAVKRSTFEPGKLEGKPVPVWIDVRVVFRGNRTPAVPQVLIAERDLAPPEESQLEDKHHHALSYTPPFMIHTVDADFVDPFAKNPYVQVAVVTVLVDEQGIPKEVRVRRGLGFGLAQKAVAAVQHYKFLPAMQHGKPVAARSDINVSFVEF
jgi:TonB family protein